MIKVNFFLILLFIGIKSIGYSQQEKPKKYQSLLWEITGKGMTKPSYLYGTMHVSNKIAFNLPDSFFIALKNSKAVALELDMDKWMDDIISKQLAEKYDKTVPYLDDFNGFYRSAFTLDLPTNNVLKSVLQFSPTISNNLMYRNHKQNSDYEEDNYLDVFIFQTGKKLKKQIIGLENFAQTEEFSIKSYEEEDEIDEKIVEEEKDQRRLRLRELRGDKSYSELLEDSYRKGDLDFLDSLNKLSSSKNHLKFMLYERNKIMAKRMDSIMQKTSLFTGVGASHLPGNEGVIELLREMGYKVRPVNITKSDIKTKIQIDEIRFPTHFNTQYSSDSLFSVAIPGNLTEMKRGGSFNYYLYNDLSNGSYYCIQRMNHYGRLMNETQDYILARIDSLIFENIPGKLLSKKEIKHKSGYPGIEIRNKTAKGDVQRHQLFITPNEIISFKMSGIQEYVNKGNEADLFFNSITFYEPEKTNFDYQSHNGYRITIPSRKNICNNFAVKNQTQLEIVNASDRTKDGFSLVISASLFDFEYIEEDTFELNMLAERFGLETNKKIVSKQITTLDNKPTLIFKMISSTDKNQICYGKIIINGPDYILLCTNKDSLTSFEFFNSFKITPKLYNTPFKKIEDTLLHYNVEIQDFKNEYTLIYDNEYLRNKIREDKKNKEKSLFLPKEELKVFVSPETREKVFVESRKFSRYFQFESMDKFWNNRLDLITNNGSLKITRKQLSNRGNTSEYTILLSDTGSTRGIQVKMIQRCGMMFTLKTVIDTTIGLQGFSKKLFDSFSIKDTCIGIDVTSNKLDLYFFNKIYQSDTTESNRAIEAVNYVAGNMLESNIPSLIKTIDHKQFNTLPVKVKQELIGSFEHVKSEEILPFLKNLYAKYIDSVDIQLSILRVLAKQKTKEANTLFLRLLNEDVPITTNEYSITNIFNNFSDSLESAVVLFPGIIKYTKYPEYRNNIYKLMAQIVGSDLIKKKSYNKVVGDILLDANYDLKKYISSKERDKDEYRYSYNKVESVYDELNTKQQKIYNYITILAPYYSKKEVNGFFNKLVASTTNDKFRAIIYTKLLANKITINDTLSTYFSKSLSSRHVLYTILEKQNNLHLFEKTYLNQRDLVISQLFGNKENIKNDTIVYLSTHNVKYENKSGNIYVFKIRAKDKKIWKLGYSAVHPDNQIGVNLDPDFTVTNFSYESDLVFQKEINRLKYKIRAQGRMRADLDDFINEEESNDYYYDE
jgi:uncharacterized protein YbaP (TraB family)